MNCYQKVLAIVFTVFWIWMAVDPVFRHSWLMENVAIFVFLPLVIFVGRHLQMPSVWYTLIAIFMMLHIVGAHFTYEEVPIGFKLGELFSSDRNMYDRFVHLCFGLLITYPAFETFKRAANVGEYWSYFFTFNFVMMLAAGYEVAEWITSVNSSPQASLAFLGAQGDIWDTQIDIYLAGLGCLFTLAVIWILTRRGNLPSKRL